MAEWHDTTEEYLEAILEIEEEGTIPIRARLVERLGLSAPAVSETVNRLVEHGYAELLDDPGTCPHGNPIPGSASAPVVPLGAPLATTAPGKVLVQRISEKVEIDDDAIAFLAQAQLIPGHDAIVVGPEDGGVRVKSDSGDQLVPRDLAQLVYVSPV